MTFPILCPAPSNLATPPTPIHRINDPLGTRRIGCNCFPWVHTNAFFPVPSSVLTSEAVLPCLSIFQPPDTSRIHFVSRRCCRRSTRGKADRWQATIRRRHSTAVESLHWCSVIPGLIQKLLRRIPASMPLLMTMLAKSQSRND